MSDIELKDYGTTKRAERDRRARELRREGWKVATGRRKMLGRGAYWYYLLAERRVGRTLADALARVGGARLHP